MHTIGIIAEFNPLHNGHAYMIEQARLRSGADAVIVVMSGDFVQRGLPAIVNKYDRTELALKAGADLVLELPAAAAAGSAQRFAEGAAAILDGLGIVDELWFGSEEGTIERVEKAAAFFRTENDPLFRKVLQEELRNGSSYPAARMQAMSACFPEEAEAICSLLSSPNNILGLEYCIALKKRGSTILPRTLPRIGAGYNEDTLQDGCSLNSASAIRKAISASGTVSAAASGAVSEIVSEAASGAAALPPEVLSQVPAYAAELLDSRAQTGAFVYEDDFSSMLCYQLWKEDARSLTRYLDVSPDLADRIIRLRPLYNGFSGFAAQLKNKSMTRSQINRALLHILLGITEESLDTALHPSFARILGFRRSASGILTEIKKAGGLPTVTGADVLNSPAYAADLFASVLYESVLSEKSGQPFVHECSRKLIVLQ